jgi:hypothetical protein
MLSFSRGALAGLLMLLAAGCDFYATPERHIDTEAQPPVVAAANFTDLPPGQVLTGTVPLRIDLDSLNQTATEVTLHVDNVEVGDPVGLPLPRTVALSTADFPDGPHTLILRVHDGGTRLGLGGFAGRTTHTFTAAVTFRQTPLVAPTVTDTTWADTGEVTVAWTPVAHPFFEAYRVLRRADWDNEPEWTEVARIDDPAVTSVTDSGPVDLGAVTDYRVGVLAAHTEAVHSEIATVRFGTAVFAGGTTRRPFPVARQNAIVAAGPEGDLQAVDENGGALLWETSPWISHEDLHAVMSIDPVNVTADERHLLLRVLGQREPYATHDVVHLYTLNLDAPAERTRRIEVGMPVADAVAGRAGRLVVLDSTGSVHVVDAATGASLDQISGIGGQHLRVTGDRRTALVLNYTGAGRCVVTSVDVSTDTLRRRAERLVPLAGTGCRDSVFEGPDVLVVRRTPYAVEQWDARTLQPQAALDLSAMPGFGASDWIRDVLVGTRGTYLVVQHPAVDPSRGPRGTVLRADASTLRIAQTWGLQVASDRLGAPASEAHLFVYGGPFAYTQRPDDGPSAWKIALP